MCEDKRSGQMNNQLGREPEGNVVVEDNRTASIPALMPTGTPVAGEMSAAALPGKVVALLVDAPTAASLCGVCRATWWSLNAQGHVPRPIHLGRRTLWSREELQEWIRYGCPPRIRWEERKKLRG